LAHSNNFRSLLADQLRQPYEAAEKELAGGHRMVQLELLRLDFGGRIDGQVRLWHHSVVRELGVVVGMKLGEPENFADIQKGEIAEGIPQGMGCS
jgi:hypothetical protein